MSRSDKVAIVTGASKGIGSGIATVAIGSATSFLTTLRKSLWHRGAVCARTDLDGILRVRN